MMKKILFAFSDARGKTSSSCGGSAGGVSPRSVVVVQSFDGASSA